jgi:hypothetical protein
MENRYLFSTNKTASGYDGRDIMVPKKTDRWLRALKRPFSRLPTSSLPHEKNERRLQAGN